MPPAFSFHDEAACLGVGDGARSLAEVGVHLLSCGAYMWGRSGEEDERMEALRSLERLLLQ